MATMNETGAMTRNRRIRHVVLSAALLPAVLLGAGACDWSGSAAGSAQGTATSSVAPTSGATSDTSASTPGKSPHTAVGASLPDKALSTFLVNVVKGDFAGACKMTAALKNDGTLAPSNPANCTAVSADPQVKSVFTKLHEAVTPAGAANAIPSIVVNGVIATGTSVRVMPNQITIDNKSLQDILSANPTAAPGLNSFPIDKIGNRWFVVSFL